MDSEEGADAGLCVSVLDRDRTQTRVQRRVCGGGSKTCLPPRYILRATTPACHGAAPLTSAGFLRRPGADVAGPGSPGRVSPFGPQNSVEMRKCPGLEQPPVREAKVRSAAIARTRSRLRWSEMAAETGPSNGAQDACSFHCRWIHDAGLPRDGTAAAGSIPNRELEGMTRTCKNEVMRRTGAEAG
jgi:hypothetical protein